eukprot:1716559-Alexandrium_andersonii.AAC.2
MRWHAVSSAAYAQPSFTKTSAGAESLADPTAMLGKGMTGPSKAPLASAIARSLTMRALARNCSERK